MIGQRVGYVRVSSFDQNPERQLEDVELDRTFSDKASGKDAKRPQLKALMTFVRAGDTVVVHSMDRLARNLDDLRQIVQTLTRRGIRIEFVKEHLAFTGEDSPMANLMLSVMGRSRSSSARSFASGNARGSRSPNNAAPIAVVNVRCPIRRSLMCAAVLNAAKPRRSSRASTASAARPCTSICAPKANACRAVRFSPSPSAKASCRCRQARMI
jgi:hypothetical protein